MKQITLQLREDLISKLPKSQSDIEDVLKLGLAEYEARKDMNKRERARVTNIKDYAVCGMWADREEMVDSAKWVREIRKTHWEGRLTK